MRPRDHAVDILANMGEKERESARTRLSAMQGGTWPPPDPSGRTSPKTFVNHQVIVQDDCASDCWMAELPRMSRYVSQTLGTAPKPVAAKPGAAGAAASARGGRPRANSRIGIVLDEEAERARAAQQRQEILEKQAQLLAAERMLVNVEQRLTSTIEQKLLEHEARVAGGADGAAGAAPEPPRAHAASADSEPSFGDGFEDHGDDAVELVHEGGDIGQKQDALAAAEAELAAIEARLAAHTVSVPKKP